MTKRNRMLIMIGILIIGTVPVWAIFGFGDIVYDPANYGVAAAEEAQLTIANGHLAFQTTQQASELAKIIQTYDQAVQTYNQITNAYNLAKQMSNQVTNKSFWTPTLPMWVMPSSTNTYGTTAGWISADTTGAGAVAGYQQATIPLQNYGSLWGDFDANTQDITARTYGTVELEDGMSVQALSQLGAIRNNTSQNNGALNALQSDSLSNDPDLNTEVGVLNKINAAGIIQARTATDTNQLLASQLDMQIIEAKRIRDAQAESINNDIYFRANAPSIDAQHLDGATAVLTTYHLP
jgi:type IV secretion system protein TrbJ